LWDDLLMEQDDPEKRVADLQRQDVKTAGPPRRELSPGRKRLALVLIIFSAVSLPGIFLAKGVYGIHAYSVGTPASATHVHCEHAGRGVSCYGEWNVAGEPPSGTIEGITDSDGSSLNVHVHNGTAYTAGTARRNFTIMAMILGVYLIPAAGITVGLVQRRRAAAKPR
jgi:hypothetical protein